MIQENKSPKREYIFINNNDESDKIFNELKAKLKDANIVLISQKLDLDKVGAEDEYNLVKNKTKFAFETLKKPVIYGEYFIRFSAISNFPGIFSDWFINNINNEKIHELLDPHTNIGMQTIFYFGIYDSTIKFKNEGDNNDLLIGVGNNDEPVMIEHIVDGRFVLPFDKEYKNIDDIFQPTGWNKTVSKLNDSEIKLATAVPRAINHLVEVLTKYV